MFVITQTLHMLTFLMRSLSSPLVIMAWLKSLYAYAILPTVILTVIRSFKGPFDDGPDIKPFYALEASAKEALWADSWWKNTKFLKCIDHTGINLGHFSVIFLESKLHFSGHYFGNLGTFSWKESDLPKLTFKNRIRILLTLKKWCYYQTKSHGLFKSSKWWVIHYLFV